jgi:ATP-dependent Lon protease
MIELGPKGTGKSHIYSEFSPDGMLISGGDISVAKLFVNNSNGKLGLVAYWNVVAFDEFAGRNKTSPKSLVDIMKNYMANRSFSRGVESITAEASMVFVGNTDNTVQHMLEHEHLFAALPPNYIDSAFLDRVHCYVPGWESDMIRREMFTSGFGLVVDFFAGVLKSLRDQDLSHLINDHFTLSSSLTTRDADGVKKTFSGLFKLLYPNGQATQDEIEELLQVSMEGRKRVKDQLMRLDPTITEVDFTYSDSHGATHEVVCKEEVDFPERYKMRPVDDSQASGNGGKSPFSAELIMHLVKGADEISIIAPVMQAGTDFSLISSLGEAISSSLDGESVKLSIVSNLEDDELLQELQIDAFDEASVRFQAQGIEFHYSFENVSGSEVRIFADGLEVWNGPLH